MENFQDFLNRHADIVNHLPFISMMISEEKSPMFVKLIETAIMAAFAFGMSVYVAVPMIQKDLVVLQKDIAKVDDKIEKVDSKVERMRGDIYKPFIDSRLNQPSQTIN